MNYFVRVLIKDRLDRVLVIRSVYGGRSAWNFPGGKVECGESLREAAIRESREEIGVFILGLEEICRLCLTIDEERWEGVFFFAEAVAGFPCMCEPHKICEVAFKPVDELPTLPSLSCLLSDVASLASDFPSTAILGGERIPE